MATGSTRHESLANSMAGLSVGKEKPLVVTELDGIVEALLKLAILDYRTEPRFRQPVTQDRVSSSSSTASSASKNSSSYKSPSSKVDKSHHRFSKLLHSNDYKMSSETLLKLKEKLNTVAMQLNNGYFAEDDDLTKRSLLRYYTELSKNPSSKDQVKSPELLVVRFVSCATREIEKFGMVPKDQLKNIIYKQTEVFVSILIHVIRPEKHSDVMIKKLEDLKASMKPSTYGAFAKQQQREQQQVKQQQAATKSSQYLKPTFNVSDMTLAQFIGRLFNIDKSQLQLQITRLENSATETIVMKQFETLLHEYDEHSDTVKYQLEDFAKTTLYLNWKSGEERALKLLIDKYRPLKIQPTLDADKNFIPKDARSYFIEVVKVCLLHDFQTGSMLSNSSQELLELCCRVWRIDAFAKITYMYTALNSTILSDNYEGDIITNFFNLFQSYQLDPETWPSVVQKEWVDNLVHDYVLVMKEIRDSLTTIFSSTKPKFGPILTVLSEIESDALFPMVASTGLNKKWERKLVKSVLKIAETRYVDILQKVPRDDSLSLLHVMNVAEAVIEDARLLSKRFPNPLLGFLYLPETCVNLSTSMFAADAKNMLLHIKSYSRDIINYGDAIEVYKMLCEVRSIFKQVSPPKKEFKFDLESFFSPYIEQWCLDSGDNIRVFISRAIKEDSFQPIDIENEHLYSTSIKDIFAMINQSLGVLKNLGWENPYQYLKFVTKLLKYISDGMIEYSNRIMEILLEDLDEQIDDIAEDQGLLNNTTDWFKSAISGSNNSVPPPKPFDFMPRTCIALNNLESLINNLQKIENTIDPETISSTIRSRNAALKPISHLFSIRIIKAENLKQFNKLPDTYVSLVDGHNKRRVLKTRIVKNSIDPEWDEEFEFVVPPGSRAMLGATIWDCSSRLRQQNVCGRTVINLQPGRFNMDGLPQDFEIDLDTEGKFIFQVSMESEREDAVFSMGRAYRAIIRIEERCVKLIVEKFLTFIKFSISRETLKLVCGHHGQHKANASVARSLLEPLFDYLNSNFQVLATNLSELLLKKVILQTWILVLNTADSILLPRLSSLNSSTSANALKSHQKRSSTSSWQNAVSNAFNGGHIIPGVGKPLTQQEVDVLFEWLKVLCYEFFYNDGAGPPIEELKNEHYQELLLVPSYYNFDVVSLKTEVEKLSPATLRLIREKHFLSIGTEKAREKNLTRAGTMARKKTILASGSARQRAIAAKEYKDARSDPVLAQLGVENLVLKLLLLKGERSFVQLRLEQRERLSKSISAEFFARLAAEGTLL